jgi:hypothetical protein
MILAYRRMNDESEKIKHNLETASGPAFTSSLSLYPAHLRLASLQFTRQISVKNHPAIHMEQLTRHKSAILAG